MKAKNRRRNNLAAAAPSFNCAVKFLRLPGSIWVESKPGPFSWQAKSENSTVESCACLCKIRKTEMEISKIESGEGHAGPENLASEKSTPVLDAGPEGLQVTLQAATEKNRASLVGIDVGNVQICRDFDGGKFLACIGFGTAFENDNLAGVVTRAPEKIILME